VIAENSKTFPRLFEYMQMMEELMKYVKGGSCVSCAKSVDFYKFENLIYSVKEDSPICIPCYDQKFPILIDHANRLKDRTVFFGIGEDKINQEMGVYNKIRIYKDLVLHSTLTNLIDWFALMAENAEEPVVTCNNC
jgi:hypothetical protein